MEMWSEERKRGSGQALVAGSVVQGAKLRPRVKRWWREVWSVGQNCGSGSNAGGGKCGPGRETAALGQALVAGSVVRGEKLWSWVKPTPPQHGPGRETAAPGQARPAREWSRERNCGFGSNAGGGKCGPGREIMVLGQTLVAGSVVQGEKLRLWVKPAPAREWSRERNCDPRSSLAPPQHGPGRETAALGQARPRLSVVQGAKPCPGSNSAPPECGPGRETATPGQAWPRRSMVQGAKLRPRVKTAPARVWSREQNRAPGSSPAPPECGPGSKTAAPGQTRPRPSVVRGSKTVPRVKLCPA